MPVSTALGRLKGEDLKFEVSVGYTGRPFLNYPPSREKTKYLFPEAKVHYGVFR
jgi:hypothetical protein